MNSVQNVLPVFMGTPTEFKITTLLDGAIKFAQDIGGYVVILAGVVLLVVGIIQIVKGLAGGGKGQVSWPMSIGCLVVGGALMFGGWALVSSIAKAGGGTLQEMNDYGNGTADTGGKSKTVDDF
jgi:protein-S-isoprenylcysteine O-methyltransferase Ste14